MLLLDSRQLVAQAAHLYLTQGGLTQTIQNQVHGCALRRRGSWN